MKKIIIGLLVFVPFMASADTQVFGFLNGQFYDVQGDLKYACLEDGNCYDYSTQGMTTISKILGLSSTEPQTITVTTGTPSPTPTPQVVYVPVPVPTAIQVTQPTSTPIPTPTPIIVIDNIPPKMITDGFTLSPDGIKVNGLSVVTDEPTTLKIELINIGDARIRNPWKENPEVKTINSWLPSLISQNPDLIITYNDELSKNHIVKFSNLNLLPNTMYSVTFTATDASGNFVKNVDSEYGPYNLNTLFNSKTWNTTDDIDSVLNN